MKKGNLILRLCMFLQRHLGTPTAVRVAVIIGCWTIPFFPLHLLYVLAVEGFKRGRDEAAELWRLYRSDYIIMWRAFTKVGR